MAFMGMHPRYPGLRLSYRRIFYILLSRWYWLLATLMIALLLTYIYLSIAPRLYATEATLKFEERRSEISELINVRNIYDRNNKLQSEQFVIRSRDVLLNAAKRLNYPVSYYEQGYLEPTELYPGIPFRLILLEDGPGPDVRKYKLKPVIGTAFQLDYTHNGKSVSRKCSINEVVTAGNIKFMIIDAFKPEQLNRQYYVQLNTPESLIGRIEEGLTITENKNTNVLSFVQKDGNAVFAANILNAILEEYITYDQGQKTRSANQTIAFIDTLQNRLSQVVRKSGTAFEQFKIQSNMLSVPGSTSQAMEKLGSLERQKADLELQLLRTTMLATQVNGKEGSGTINYDLQELKDPFLSNLLTQFNGLLLKKLDLLSTYKVESEKVREAEGQLQLLRQALANNIKAQQEKTRKTLAYIQQQLSGHHSSINKLPTAEKSFVNLQADFEVNQRVYAYLNQKKLEAQISRAAITPAATIVNKAIPQFRPVAPIDQHAYKTAVLIGLVAGIALIFIVRALNPYIFDRETLEQLTTIPIIGTIRKYPAPLPNGAQLLLDQAGNSMFAESVRALRTNISFLAPDINKKIICITSETAGEGKSFTALNLAYSLSMIDKKVIVIAADLRKSMLHQAFNSDNRMGLSSYLSGQMELEDIIIQHASGLAFISGGPIPPNPSELLYGSRMDKLLASVNQVYDYVIIDSAPVGLVSDAIPMLKAASVNLFIVRAGLSRYHAAVLPERLSKELGLTNFQIILNAFDYDKLHSPYYTYNRYGTVDKPYEARGYFGNDQKGKWWNFKYKAF